MRKGNTEVPWESPEPTAPGNDFLRPKAKPMTVRIASTDDGWDLSEDIKFHVKRLSKNTIQSYPIGTASWDTDGIWAHWTMALMDQGQVLFIKHSRWGVEQAMLDCQYVVQPMWPR